MMFENIYQKPAKTHGTIENAVSVDSFTLKQGKIKIRLSGAERSFSFVRSGKKITLKGCEWITFNVDSIETITGKQEFFICPECGNKYRFLYLDSNAPRMILRKGFRCRKCSKLNYLSQQKWHDSIEYYSRGMEYAKEKLGWTIDDAIPADFPQYEPERPRYMHRDTYERYMKKFRWYQRKYKQEYYTELLKILNESTYY